MKTIAALACLLAFAGTSGAQVDVQDAILYDTFNEDDQANLFDCCNTYSVVGRAAGYESRGMSFPIEHKGKIREIDIPMSWVSGKNRFRLKLSGNHFRHRYFEMIDVPPGGQCCVFQSLSGPVPVVRDIYYLRVSAHGETVGGWNLNSAGIIGDYSTWNGHSHTLQPGTLPAVRIIGKK